MARPGLDSGRKSGYSLPDKMGLRIVVRLAVTTVTGLMLAIGLWSCTPKPRPGLTIEDVKTTLLDAKTGRIEAGSYGWATLFKLRLADTTVKGNSARGLVEVSAEQNVFDVKHILTARLALNYTWQDNGWRLGSIEPVKNWKEHIVDPARMYESDSESDSSAIQQLQRTRKAVRRQLDGIPTP
jgi:hypothetical protein